MKKIVGVLVMTLLIMTAIPTIGIMNKNFEEEVTLQNFDGVEWSQTIDRGEFDSIRYVEQTADDEYICCGLTEESDMFYVQLLKIKSDGNVNWSVVNYNLNASIVGDSLSYLYAYYVIPTGGGYLVGGWSTVYIEEDSAWAPAAFLWKTDATGTTEWVKHYYEIENSALYLIYCVLEILDGYMTSCIKVYYDEDLQLINWNGALLKMDNDGNLEWQQEYDAGGNEQLSGLCSTSDGGYLLTGFQRDDDKALWMVKTDGDGNEEWNKTHNGPGSDYSYNVDCFQTSDGGYIMCGFTDSYGAGRDDAWVIKTDASGNMVWDKTYGDKNNDRAEDICKTNDGGYVIAIVKNLAYFGGTRDDIWLVKITEDGYTEWSYLIEEDDKQIPSYVQQTIDGGFIVSGLTDNMGKPSSDGILYKLSSIENQRPNKPTCKYDRKTDELVVSATDLDGDQIRYSVDWENDGIIDHWTELLDSGVEVRIDCEEKTGPFGVMAEDEHGGQSDSISVKSKDLQINTPFLQFLEQHQHMFPLLRQLLELN